MNAICTVARSTGRLGYFLQSMATTFTAKLLKKTPMWDILVYYYDTRH